MAIFKLLHCVHLNFFESMIDHDFVGPQWREGTLLTASLQLLQRRITLFGVQSFLHFQLLSLSTTE